MNPDRPSRRAALGSWITGALSTLLLAACVRPSDAATEGSEPAAASGQVPAAVAQTGAGPAASTLPACVLTPQQTEGPYFVDERLNRSDIRADPASGALSEGVPLKLTMNVSQVAGSTCTPLAETIVDIWQCDARGVYSDVNDNHWGSSVGNQFLRGYQVTDQNGVVQFTTVYPGWYQGRTVHIHFKVRTALDSGAREQTSQLYFDDALTDEVHALAPYAAKGTRTTRNSQDGIFRNGGDTLTLQVARDGEGYAGTFDLGVQLN